MEQVRGCHLVGSVPFESTEAVLRKCSSGMQGRLRRIPDGETGNRTYFIQFQRPWFMAAPEMLPDFSMNKAIEQKHFTPEQVRAGVEKLKANPRKTGYEDYAIESYGVFKKLRDEGAVPKGTKFQVSIPTHINALLGFVERDFQPDVEPIYREALWQAMRNIQEAIPHEDLAIQIDIASEYVFLENLAMYRPWFFNDDKDFDKRKEYIYNYILKQIGQVAQDVELGLHNCYGDMMHQHFVEPDSLAIIAETGKVIFERTPHPISFFHCPVPPSAQEKLDHYYEPLNSLLPMLKRDKTELYLGVVREFDLEGTKIRTDAAKKAFPHVTFGVATECGLGRVSAEVAESVLSISSEVSAPVI